MNDPYAPIGVLLYVGPTGVGKTELAKELSKTIFGNEQSLIRLNMSEYAEDGSVFRLIGSPRGYEGYKEGGELTEQLKKNPYAIVLLDEIEKASPSILKLFLQLFDEGFICDSQGTWIDCRNMLFILTSNLEGSRILTMHDLGHSDLEILDSIQPALMQTLSSKLYGRLTPILFRGLKENVMEGLIKKMLSQTTDELFNKTRIIINFDSSIICFLKKNGFDYQLGARPFKLLIKQTVLVAITDALKQRYIQKQDQVLMGFSDNHFTIQHPKKKESFTWRWNNDKEGITPPFKLDDLLHLEHKLQQKILGQPYAIKITVASLMRYAAGLANQKSPIGAFLYVGPTGVGKTQLAKELAIELMGSESHLIRLDMSEYSESHSMTRLIGSPPGYVNHEEGGQLTEALKRHPYAIVLLDEIEKAHPLVLKTFLQVFDEGRLSDSKGTFIDCRNVIFIATTNLGAAKILDLYQKGISEQEILGSIRSDIAHHISPELYNRLEVAPFMGLSTKLLDQLIENMLQSIQYELYINKKIEVKFTSSIFNFLRIRGYDYELGARPLKRVIQQTIMTAIAKEMIEGHLRSGDCIEVAYRNDEVLILKKMKENFR